jgi:hypothetical protein
VIKMILNKFSNSTTKEFRVNISYKKIINTLTVDTKKKKKKAIIQMAQNNAIKTFLKKNYFPLVK